MEMIERIAGIILPVFAIVGVGYGYGRLRGAMVKEDMAVVNRISMDILCPLLIFTALAAREFDVVHNADLIFAGLVISLGSGLLAWPVAKALNYDVRSFVPPMMYNNCGNMGLPLAALAFGPAGLSAAVALFMACNLVYFSAGVKILESGRRGPKTPFLQFMRSPMMMAMLIGIAFSLLGFTIPEPLFTGMSMLGQACIPLMLFALGVRMLEIEFHSWRIGLVGAAVCPLAGIVVAVLLDQVLSLTEMQRGQMYLFASLPPAVFCFMMAERYQQEPDKVASIVLLGNLAAFAFVPLGLWLGLPRA